MPRLTKIYTRTGDDGMTALGTRERVSKDNRRVAVYGEIDELNAFLGVALSSELQANVQEPLLRIQNELFNLGAQLAFPVKRGSESKVPQIRQLHIDELESLIDQLNKEVGTLENFILPGGSKSASMLHFARTVCRRAERSLVALMHEEHVDKLALVYLNRLSDLLFVMARYENKKQGVQEITWDTSA